LGLESVACFGHGSCWIKIVIKCRFPMINVMWNGLNCIVLFSWSNRHNQGQLFFWIILVFLLVLMLLMSFEWFCYHSINLSLKLFSYFCSYNRNIFILSNIKLFTFILLKNISLLVTIHNGSLHQIIKSTKHRIFFFAKSAIKFNENMSRS